MFVDEVRSGIPADDAPGMTLAEALDDPELNAVRDFGAGSIGVGAYASTDSLTLLSSHSHFRERLHAEVARAALGESGIDRLALLLVRANNLGVLNRELGYAGADRLLELLARQVERAAVDCGGIAGRDDGSRMAILVPDLDPAAAEGLASQLRERAPDGLELSVGTAAWEPGESGEELLAEAHRRLRAAGETAPTAG